MQPDRVGCEVNSKIMAQSSGDLATAASQAVLFSSTPMPEGSVPVRGYDFSGGVNYQALLATYKTSGFQATNFGLAVEEIKKMVR